MDGMQQDLQAFDRQDHDDIIDIFVGRELEILLASAFFRKAERSIKRLCAEVIGPDAEVDFFQGGMRFNPLDKHLDHGGSDTSTAPMERHADAHCAMMCDPSPRVGIKIQHGDDFGIVRSTMLCDQTKFIGILDIIEEPFALEVVVVFDLFCGDDLEVMRLGFGTTVLEDSSCIGKAGRSQEDRRTIG